MCAACPAHPLGLDILIFGEDYKLWRSALCSFLVSCHFIHLQTLLFLTTSKNISNKIVNVN
jgi:hypothetical protein